MNSTWKAGRNFHPETSMNDIKGLLGVHPHHRLHLPSQKPSMLSGSSDPLPESFDPREKWPECPTLNYIPDQGGCGSCWAFGAVTTMSDRMCIHTNGAFKKHVSAENLLRWVKLFFHNSKISLFSNIFSFSCCFYCGFGCQGGWPGLAWNYWASFGLVTGGDYGTNDGCQPYEIEPCGNLVNSTRGSCYEQLTPSCSEVNVKILRKFFSVNFFSKET